MTTSNGSLADLKIDRDSPERAGLWPLLGALLLFAALAAAGWWWYTRPRAVAVRTAPVREVSAAETSRQVLLNASGYLVARRQATVSSKITGKVVEVAAEEGATAAAGQVLARLDDTNAKIAMNLAAAQAEAARAALQETGVRITEAEKEHRRVSRLTEQGIAATAEFDRADAELNALRARLEKQRRDAAVAEHQEAMARQELDDLVIRAPFGGVITAKSAQPGEMISPISAGGGFTRTGICTLVDMGSLEIEVDVGESYLNRVRPAQAVEALLDAYPDWKIPCHVIAVIPAADRQKATVKVRIAFEKLDPRLLPDMGVKVAFLGTQEAAGAADGRPSLRIPRSAVRHADGRDWVFAVRGERAERLPVEVEDPGGDEFVVRTGLRAGDRVVTEAPAALKTGDRVREKAE